jgi:hypothetical protein
MLLPKQTYLTTLNTAMFMSEEMWVYYWGSSVDSPHSMSTLQEIKTSILTVYSQRNNKLKTNVQYTHHKSVHTH